MGRKKKKKRGKNKGPNKERGPTWGGRKREDKEDK